MAQPQYLPGVRIPKVVPGSVAEAAGIRRGDVVIAVGDRPISNSRESVNSLLRYIKYASHPPIISYMFLINPLTCQCHTQTLSLAEVQWCLLRLLPNIKLAEDCFQWYMGPCHCRDHPEKQLTFRIARKDGVVDIPVTTALDAQGDGMIGAQLSTYAKITREAAKGPVDAAGKAGSEFGRMVSLVAKGEPSSRDGRVLQAVWIATVFMCSNVPCHPCTQRVSTF